MQNKEARRYEESGNKRQTRFSYSQGPIFYVGQQIVRAMQESGYPAKIHCCYRSAQTQAGLVEKGVSKARPFQSPHQYFLAVDIIHPEKGWNVEQAYWDQLKACGEVVSEKFDIPLEFGYDWGWDMAHIEFLDFRVYREKMNQRARNEGLPGCVPSPLDLASWFEELLPRVWKQRTFS